MGSKVIFILSIFIGMVLLVSSQVGAARVLAHTSNTVETSVKTKPVTGCTRNVYGSCIPKTPTNKKRRCEYGNSCRRGGGPPQAQP